MTTPHVDLTTGKIYGCKKNSWMWWHEKGHIEFNNLHSTSSLKLWQGYIFLLWMFALTLSVINRYMIYASLPLLASYVGIEVYEEKWCNSYADKHFKK